MAHASYLPGGGQADLRIDHADWLLTLDGDRRILTNGAVAVAGGTRFEKLGKEDP